MPFPPVRFSGLIDRLCASDIRKSEPTLGVISGASADGSVQLARLRAEKKAINWVRMSGPVRIRPHHQAGESSGQRASTRAPALSHRQQRFRRALDVEGRITRGESVSNADAVWLGGYQQGSEYRSMRTLYEDGGEQVLR